MTITRRQFVHAGLGLGSAFSGWLAGCGGSDDPALESPALALAPATQSKSFNFDLRFAPPEDILVLRAGGRRYPLQRHTDATRAATRAARPGLARVPDAHLTHYADDVLVSTKRQQRMHVTAKSPTRGHGVALVFMHIPTLARIKARRQRGLVLGAICRACLSGGEGCALEDDGVEDFATGRSTAKSIITHYPDILNLDADVAAQVETLMDGDQAAAVDNLTVSICIQGPAYEYDPNYPDGWAILVPRLNADGTPIRDSQGDPTFDYNFSAQTSLDLLPAVTAIVQAVKNDATLNGQQYQVLYHGDVVDTASLPPPNGTPLVASNGMLAAASPRGSGSGSQVTFGDLGYQHNILFFNPQASAVDRTLSLSIMNMNFIWYGLYLEYLDGAGKPMAATGSGALAGLLQWIQIETDTLPFWDMISSPPAIFGLPIPFPYRVSLTLPNGASSVRLHLIGPGGYGDVPYGPAVVPGILMTAIIQYVLPFAFLVSGSGIDETVTLTELILDKPSIWIKTLSEGMQILSATTGSNTNDFGLEGSVASLLGSVIQNILLVPLERFSPELWDWITEKFTTEEIEEGVPFAGWIIRAVALAGTAGAMLATSAEVGSNPIVITNTVSFTHTVTFEITPDPTDFEFPLSAKTYTVEVTAGGTALSPATRLTLGDVERSAPKLSVTIGDIPATGAAATVKVTFETADGSPVAYGATPDSTGKLVAGDVSFISQPPADGSNLIVAVRTIENPLSITKDTRYTHHQKLSYAAGKYAWNFTSTPPALEPAACGPGGLCDLGSVTVWLPGGMIGYSWLASSPGVLGCSNGAQGQLYTFQNVSLKSDPNVGRKTPGCGFPGATPLAYDAAVPVGSNGYNFYLDAVRTDDADPEYLLRRIVLDNSTPIPIPPTQNWGRFRVPIDRIAVYAKGPSPRVVGISSRYHKLAVLELPPSFYAGDQFANNAKLMCGMGEGNDALLMNPRALTIADNGAVLVLQGGLTKSVKAFDFDGKPWRFFSNNQLSLLPLAQDASEVTWLDISIDPTNLLYLLSYAGAGTLASDYRLDVYDCATAARVVRNSGIAVARIVVDKFRGLYTLNRETVKGSPNVEPSVSLWSPG